MKLENVLQLNVRLSEGGAAGVARTLADELMARGIQSPIAYGYARRGGRSPLEAEYGAVRITPRLHAAVNRVSHSLIGRDTKLVSRSHWDDFRSALAAADVVHLHAFHSHIVDAEKLFMELEDAKKPVVWTLHDQWAMTGRCAQPGICRLWESGCLKCPDLKAYPPAKIDNAARRWPQRRSMIRRLQDSVPTSVVACADWLAEEAEVASIRNVTVIKNSVDRAFWDACGTEKQHRDAGEVKNLFMCRDLRDRQKVNWPLLRRVAALSGQSLTIVGDLAPEEVDGAVRHPAISDRTRMAELMRQHDRLIFTSKIDYFPLTIAEALTAGLEVDALDSQAAREFLGHPKLTLFEDEASLLRHLGVSNKYAGSAVAEPGDYRNFFDPRRMTDEYVKVYRSLLDC